MSISEAAHQMAANQVRNIGTVGGNLINAVPSADLPPILMALSASVKLVRHEGRTGHSAGRAVHRRLQDLLLR